jgi:hypothetical protein
MRFVAAKTRELSVDTDTIIFSFGWQLAVVHVFCFLVMRVDTSRLIAPFGVKMKAAWCGTVQFHTILFHDQLSQAFTLL